MEFLRTYRFWILGVALVLVTGFCVFLFAPPAHFPSGSIVVVPEGSTAISAAEDLAEAGVIAHPIVLRAFLKITGAGSRIQAGAYLFESPESVLSVAYRLRHGISGIPPVRITFPEGMSVREMAPKIEDAFGATVAAEFLTQAKAHEGYLFPDTYLFAPDSDAATLINTMRKNFDTKTASLTSAIRASGRSIADIVTMASLIEKEARTTEVRKVVSGILWNRLRLDMPLQADAVFGYIYGRDTYSPTYADLTIDSPYNVYKYRGLPPGPINNPGIDAIKAAIEPSKTDYLFYLVDKNGVIHYAKTYAEHQANENAYLK